MFRRKLKRIVELDPAFDRRSPDPSKNHGIHCVELRMVLKGRQGAVNFTLFTGWNLPHVKEEMQDKPADLFPMAADLGYHSKKPKYDGQEPMGSVRYSFKDGEYDENFADGKIRMPKRIETGTFTICAYTGGKCYYDGSGLNAERVFQVLLTEGGDGVWRELENFYNEIFPPFSLLSEIRKIGEIWTKSKSRSFTKIKSLVRVVRSR